MNKRGFELAVSTLVIVIIAVLVAAVLIFAFTGSFSKFWNTLKGFFISDVETAKKACENACAIHLEHDFCCYQREVDFGKGKENLTCGDARLKINCGINCSEVC